MLTYEERKKVLNEIDTMLDGILSKVRALSDEEDSHRNYGYSMSYYYEHLGKLTSKYSDMKYLLDLTKEDLDLAHIHHEED